MATFAEDTLPPDVVHALLGRSSLRVREWGAASRRGASRPSNEDAYGERGRTAFVVADGMGGRAGGAVASRAAVETLLARLGGEPTAVDWRTVIIETNDEVRRAATDAGVQGAGAAAAALRIVGGRATLVHLGDVRAYRLDDGGATQLTSDHNVANELARARLDPRRLRFHPAELTALTVFFGDPDSAGGFGIRGVNVAPGDRLVLCTDGVHGALGPDGWQAAAGLSSASRLAEALVDAAVAAGSTDDATALVVAVGGRP
jgi:protein phosphatase